MGQRRSALLLGLLVCSPASYIEAHDFWLQPSEYWINSDTLDSMTLQVGHGPFRQRSPIPLRRITRFQQLPLTAWPLTCISGFGSVRVSRMVTFGLMTRDICTSPANRQRCADAPTRHSIQRLSQVEGLTPALDQRARLQRMDADGSERYSRCAKSIVQVGPPAAGLQGQITKPVGLPLEIVPEANPYGAKRSATLPVRVLYAGHALAGALVSSPILRMTLLRSKCV